MTVVADACYAVIRDWDDRMERDGRVRPIDLMAERGVNALEWAEATQAALDRARSAFRDDEYIAAFAFLAFMAGMQYEARIREMLEEAT